jgi:hypothetical protein
VPSAAATLPRGSPWNDFSVYPSGNTPSKIAFARKGAVGEKAKIAWFLVNALLFHSRISPRRAKVVLMLTGSSKPNVNSEILAVISPVVAKAVRPLDVSWPLVPRLKILADEHNLVLETVPSIFTLRNESRWSCLSAGRTGLITLRNPVNGIALRRAVAGEDMTAPEVTDEIADRVGMAPLKLPMDTL